jgi:hypothetical protein
MLGSVPEDFKRGGHAMRTATLIVACALAGATSPAFAQARILTTPEAAPAPVPAQQAQTPAPAAPPQTMAPSPPAKTQDQLTQQAPRQDQAPRLPAGRFGLKRVDNGFLRLDRQSGKVAFCHAQSAGWDCEAVPEDRAALEKEIAALRDTIAGLQDQVATLNKEIAALRAPPPPPPPPPPDHNSGIKIPLPNAQDMARARGFLADTWHRLVEMIQSMQKDMLRKS